MNKYKILSKNIPQKKGGERESGSVVKKRFEMNQQQR